MTHERLGRIQEGTSRKRAATIFPLEKMPNSQPSVIGTRKASISSLSRRRHLGNNFQFYRKGPLKRRPWWRSFSFSFYYLIQLADLEIDISASRTSPERKKKGEKFHQIFELRKSRTIVGNSTSTVTSSTSSFGMSGISRLCLCGTHNVLGKKASSRITMWFLSVLVSIWSLTGPMSRTDTTGLTYFFYFFFFFFWIDNEGRERRKRNPFV